MLPQKILRFCIEWGLFWGNLRSKNCKLTTRVPSLNTNDYPWYVNKGFRTFTLWKIRFYLSSDHFRCILRVCLSKVKFCDSIDYSESEQAERNACWAEGSAPLVHSNINSYENSQRYSLHMKHLKFVTAFKVYILTLKYSWNPKRTQICRTSILLYST